MSMKIELDNARPVAGIREASGLSQRELCAVMDVAPTWVHKAEGRRGQVRLDTLIRAAEAAGFELELCLRPVAADDES